MSRAVGVTDALGTALPDPVVVGFALVTLLGGSWFFFPALSVLYWFADDAPRWIRGRRHAVALVALALLALAVTTALKSLFALPRPPGADAAAAASVVPPAIRPLYAAVATSDGFGFPSGHALGSTVVWGAAAVVLRAGRRRDRYLLAGAVVALVSLSRLVLGVHYLVDVLAGVAVGLIVLGVGLVALDGVARPERLLSLSVLVALAGVAVGGLALDPLSVLGATLGARVAWGGLGTAALDTSLSGREAAACLTVGLPVFGGLFGYTRAADPPWAVTLAASALVLAGILALPVAVAALGRRSAATST